MISVNSDSLSLLVRRNINSSTSSINTALERMSTGYKVNRAKDDAANMSISENLKTQINSAKVLKKGTSMGMDVLSTVESALNDINNSLFRIRDLTLQQMNGVYDTNSLNAINAEINQQIENIVQITKRTNFNGKNLLDGTAKSMLIPLYDTPDGLSSINLDDIFKTLDFVDVFTGKKDLYFIDAKAGETYYADFDGKLYAITSDKNQQVIYNFTSGAVEFIDCEGVTATELGKLDESYTQLGNDEKYLQMEANKSYYLKSGNKVFELKNTNAISQIAIFKDDGAGGFTLVEGAGVQKTELYDLDSYTAINSGQSLKLTAGTTQHLIFNNKLYEISAAKNQTLIFNNKNGNLNPLAGTDGVTINKVGNMKTGVTTGLASYVQLNPNETKYYEFNGNIYQIKNNKSSKQNFIIDSNNNIKDSNGNVVRTQLASTSVKSFSSYENLQSMGVIAGQDYYLKNEDGSGVTKITANTTGSIYFDKVSNGYNKFQGASVSVSNITDYEEVTPDSSNRFSLSVRAGETKYISLNNEIYTIKNDTGADFTKTFEYDSSSKSMEEIVVGGIVRLTEDEAIAQGYSLIKTAGDLDNVRNNLAGKYILMNDIDLSGYAEWTPFGTLKGVFDGNGFAVKNLKINKPTEDDIALFSGNEGEIKNLGVENVDIKGKNFVSAIAAWNSWGGSISNCYATGNIQALDCTGGLVGDNYIGDITNCYFSGNVTGSDGTGGIAGKSYNGNISDCFVTGSVNAKTSVGGITGENSGTSVINDCYVTAVVSGSGTVIGALAGNNSGTVSNSFWDTQKTGTFIGLGNNTGSSSGIRGLTTAELSDPKIFEDAGWDTNKWDLSTSPPSLNFDIVTPLLVSKFADFSTSTSQTASNLRYVDNLSGTSYFKFEDDIYEIKNNGAPQDVFFDYDSTAGSLTVKNAPDIELKKVDKAVFTSLNNTNFSTQLNAGESQYMAFTINGKQRVYKVTNNSADKQTVIYEKTNNITIKSGENVVIEEYTDMVRSTDIKNNSFYIDFAGETKKNININGHFYEITNNDANTALFKINGNNIVQVSGNSASVVSKAESFGSLTDAGQYSIELNPNETIYLKFGSFAYEMKNNTAVKQTQIFSVGAGVLNSLNPNVTSITRDLSNTPMQQMLIKTDWAINEIMNRRSAVGAAENILDASISRNTNVEQNLAAARSTIMDADFAEESSKLVKNRILQNVSVSLFTQVNYVKREIVMSLIG